MIFFLENLRNPARLHRVAAMRQFPTAQLNSTTSTTEFSRQLLMLQLAREPAGDSMDQLVLRLFKHNRDLRPAGPGRAGVSGEQLD